MDTQLNILNQRHFCLGYIGCLWIDNLGDKILLDSTKRIFSPISVKPFSYGRKTRIIEFCTKKDLFNGVLLGGGTLINNGAYIQPYHNAFTRYKKIFVFGTGVRDPEFWGTKKSSLNEWKDLLENCDFIGVRGPISKKILQEVGLKNVNIIGDPALYFGEESYRNKVENKTIGINLADCGDELWGNVQSFERFIIELSTLLIQDGWKIKFCSMNKKDEYYINYIQKKVHGATQMFRMDRHPDKILSFFNDCQIFIGQRLHSGILSICSHTPTLMLEYRTKCLDFMTSMGLEKYCIRTNNLSTERTLELLNELTSNSGSIQNLIFTKIKFFKNELSKSADIITNKLLND